MNILIFSWRGPGHPNAGGAEISTHEHAKGWVKAGHKVTLFTSTYRNAKKLEYIDGVRIIRKGSQTIGVHLTAFKWFIFDRKERFDLIVDQFHGIPFFTPLYVRVKKLAFIHEVTKDVWRLNPWQWPFNRIVAFIGEVFEPLVFKLLYRKIWFMTVSNSTKEDLVEWGIPEGQITIVNNGVKIPRINKLPPKERKKTAIFLGAISKDKGAEDAIEICAQILRKEKNWQFWVVGKAEARYLIFLKKLSQSLGVSKNIKFFGFVSDKEKYRLLSKAHILINLSIREGWGLVIIEAGAMGTPAAAFNVSGLRDSIINNKTGIISSKSTVDDLARIIFKLINNVKQYKQMSKNAKIWSKKFSWKESVRLSLQLIESNQI